MSTQPYLPFARPTLDEATITSVAEVLRSGWITSGPKLKAFEAALSEYAGGRHVRCVSSATAALELALRVCGIGPGDEVITPAMTFFAAPNMIVRVGATPVFVDVEPGTRNLDLAAVAARIGPRTRAILPTHFAGLPCDMDAVYALAAKHKLRVIEDAALAIGSSWRGKRIGSFGDICIFSFHPNKNITSIEGGALVMGNEHEAREIEVLRFHGISYLPDRTRDVAEAGGKFNLPDVNAAVGLRQLAQLPEFNAKRRAPDLPLDAAADVADTAPAADTQLETRERDRRLAAAIDALPDRQRTAIVLIYQEGLSNAETAALLDTSVSGVETLLVRAKRALRIALAE